MGSMVVAAATAQFGLASDSATLGASLRAGAAGTQVALVFAAVTPSASCPAYRGQQEGTALDFALFDYGSVEFAPAGFVVNSTSYPGASAAVAPGALGQFSLGLAACAHPSGLTIFAYDTTGDVGEFGT